jgi:large-conductance mechanosensitive channel
MNNFNSNFEIEQNTFNFFNIDEFRKFLIENKVSVSIVSFAVAYYLKELIDSFYENIIFCEDNTKKIDAYDMCIFGINIRLGRFIISILKFIVSCILIFYIARFLTDIVN